MRLLQDNHSDPEMLRHGLADCSERIVKEYDVPVLGVRNPLACLHILFARLPRV